MDNNKMDTDITKTLNRLEEEIYELYAVLEQKKVEELKKRLEEVKKRFLEGDSSYGVDNEIKLSFGENSLQQIIYDLGILEEEIDSLKKSQKIQMEITKFENILIKASENGFDAVRQIVENWKGEEHSEKVKHFINEKIAIIVEQMIENALKEKIDIELEYIKRIL